jgi:hypothetical protein
MLNTRLCYFVVSCTTVRNRLFRSIVFALFSLVVISVAATDVVAAELKAGAAKVDITNLDAGPVDGRLHVRAVVISDGTTKAVIVTVDAVAIGEIGPIKNDYLGKVRGQVEKDLGIKPTNIMINASHCHGTVCTDVAERTVKAIKTAVANMVPVTIGVGVGHEDEVGENRRLKLKNGKTIDVRHAYSMPTDEDVAELGPIDPQIGILKLDRMDGRTLAVVYNFACHPIMGVPSGANTADITGFSSEVIEDNLSEGTVALFVQGCGGDINPVFYKDVDHPRGAEPLGNRLGLSTLKAVRKIKTKADSRLKVLNEVLALPRSDNAGKIEALEAERVRLTNSLRGTNLNLKTFMELSVKYKLSTEFPSYYSHGYLLDEKLGRDDLNKMDAYNRSNMKAYIRNVYTMEQLTRVNTNLRLLNRHQAENVAAGKRTVDVELVGIRVGDFVLTTFPGELTVRIGLNIKKKSAHKFTFVAGYTNGYIYYAPTTEQLENVGGAQEDSDCILAPHWQKIYEDKAAAILKKL